jgi:RIO kinase 1
MGQAVLIDHPKAMEFLKRDIRNLVRFFRKLGIKSDEEQIYEEVVGEGDEA